MNDSDRTLLTQLLAEVRLLNQRLTPRQRAADAEVTELLRAIVVSVGDHCFCCTDLLRRVPSPVDERLRGAISAACGALSARRIGKLLRRVEGKDIAGLRVVRTGRVERDGAVWMIVASSR